MSSKLYEIASDFVELQQALEDGLIDQQAFEDTMESIEIDFNKKVGGLLSVRAGVVSKQKAIKAEQDRLANMMKVAKNSQERIEEYLRDQMSRADVKKVEDAESLRSVSISDNAPKVLVKPESLSDDDIKGLPAKYWSSNVVFKVDTTLIKNDLKADESLLIGDFSLADGKRKLTIK